MSAAVHKLLDEAKKLPKEDRALLRAELEVLDDDVPQEEVDAAWLEEIARRVRSIEDGTAVLVDHETVMRELDEILR